MRVRQEVLRISDLSTHSSTQHVREHQETTSCSLQEIRRHADTLILLLFSLSKCPVELHYCVMDQAESQMASPGVAANGALQSNYYHSAAGKRIFIMHKFPFRSPPFNSDYFFSVYSLQRDGDGQ